MKNKPTKILLDEVHIPALNAAHAAITEGKNFFDAYDASVADMTADEKKFTSEIEALEATADYHDENAARTIHTRRGQLELLQRQLARLKAERLPHTNALVAEINQLPAFVPKLITPERNRLHRELCDKLQPVYHGGALLNSQASNTPEFLSFCNHYHDWPEAYQHNAPRLARELLPRLTSLVNGELDWVFEPDNSPLTGEGKIAEARANLGLA